MLRNDLLRTDLSRHIERNFFFKPRSFNHSRLVVFDIAEGAGHDVADAVNHSYAEMSVVGQIDFNCVLGNKLRLGCHYCSARSRLRQFVRGSFFLALILDVRNDERIHKTLDKRRLSRPDRTDNADINIAARPCLNVLVNACTCS